MTPSAPRLVKWAPPMAHLLLRPQAEAPSPAREAGPPATRRRPPVLGEDETD